MPTLLGAFSMQTARPSVTAEDDLTAPQVALLVIGVMLAIGIGFVFINPRGVGWILVGIALPPVIWASRAGWLPHAPRAAGALGVLLAVGFLVVAGPVVALGLTLRLLWGLLASFVNQHAAQQERFRGWAEFDVQVKEIWSTDWRGNKTLRYDVRTDADRQRQSEAQNAGCLFVFVLLPLSLLAGAVVWPLATLYVWGRATHAMLTSKPEPQLQAESPPLLAPPAKR